MTKRQREEGSTLALFLIPTVDIENFVDSKYKTLVPDPFDVLVVGKSVKDFQETISKKCEVVVCCGMFLPGLREIMIDLIEAVDKSPSKIVWIHSLLAGLDHLTSTPVIEYTNKLSVPVTNARGVFSSSLAEYVMCAVMYFEKQVPRLFANKAAKKWDRFTMEEIKGKTVGIIGYGNIGHAVAKALAIFDVKFLCWGKNLPKEEGMDITEDDAGLDRLFANSDYIITSLPGTPQTNHLIKLSNFKKMKQSCVFMNIGRGTVVSSDDLAEALKTKLIRGAACDVLEVEPLPQDHPLWDQENFFLSPHNADLTPGYYGSTVDRFMVLCREFFFAGNALPECVSLAQGY